MYRNYYKPDYSGYVAPVVIGLVALYAVNKILGKSAGDKAGSKETVDNAAKEVNEKMLTYKESWYSQSCDTIQSKLLMVYKSRLPGFGDQGNEAIKSVLVILTALKSRNDWSKLVAVFGVRSGFSTSIITGEPLTKWLSYFLSDKSYRFTDSKGKNQSVDAIKAVNHILNKLGVTI